MDKSVAPGLRQAFTVIPLSFNFQSKHYLNIGLWNRCAKTYIEAKMHVNLDFSHSMAWPES